MRTIIQFIRFIVSGKRTNKRNSWEGLNENIRKNDEIWSQYGRDR